MLVPNQVVENTWMPSNREHFKALGYEYTKMRDKFMVKVEDLPHGSHKKVKVICDYCGTEFTKDYVNFLSERSIGKDCCKQCQPKKFAESCEEKFGVKNPFMLDFIKEKIKLTSLEKYGTERPCQSQIIKDKIAETNLSKYGNICTLQSEEIKEKAIETLQTKYGVDNALKNEEIQQRAKKTCEAKYGKGNIAHTPEISQKIKQTNLERYGYEYSFQSPEIIAKIRKSLYENGTVPSSKPEKAMCEMLHNLYGVENCKDNFAYDRLSMDCLVETENIQIDFEYDGYYWHKDREEYDRRRNYFLLDRGFRIIRIKGNAKDELPTIEQIQKAVDYLVKDNHHITYIDMNV